MWSAPRHSDPLTPDVPYPVQVDTTGLYEVLEVEKTASQADVRKAYMKLAKKVCGSTPPCLHVHVFLRRGACACGVTRHRRV